MTESGSLTFVWLETLPDDDPNTPKRLASLARLRESRGMTQEQVAAGMGVQQGWISELENRDLNKIRIKTLFRYVRALGGTLEFGLRPMLDVDAEQ